MYVSWKGTCSPSLPTRTLSVATTSSLPSGVSRINCTGRSSLAYPETRKVPSNVRRFFTKTARSSGADSTATSRTRFVPARWPKGTANNGHPRRAICFATVSELLSVIPTVCSAPSPIKTRPISRFPSSRCKTSRRDSPYALSVPSGAAPCSVRVSSSIRSISSSKV